MKRIALIIIAILILSAEFAPSTAQFASLEINDVAFSPDGTQLAVALADQWFAFHYPSFEVSDASVVGRDVSSLAYSPDGSLLAIGAQTILLWNLQTRTVVGELGERRFRIEDLAFSPDGTILAAASNDGTITLWDLNTEAAFGVLDGDTGRVFQLAYAANGQLLAGSSSNSSGEFKVVVWNLGEPQQVIEGRHVAFSPDSSILLTGSNDGYVMRWDVATGTPIEQLELFDDRPTWVAYASETFATAGGDSVVTIWEANTGEVRHTLFTEGEPDGVYAVFRGLQYAPDGASLVTISTSVIRVWDVGTGDLINQLAIE